MARISKGESIGATPKRASYQPKMKDADSIMLFGASGSGKGYRTKQLCRKETRLVCWDSMQDWEKRRDGLTHIIKGDPLELLHVMKAGGVYRVAYLPDFANMADQFAIVCRLSFAIGQHALFIDELDEVTRANYAPPPWRSLTGRGRHRGVHLRGNGQRPGEVDKRAITNASEVWAGRLTESSDMAALRSKFGQHVAKLPGLDDGDQLRFIAGAGIFYVKKDGTHEKLLHGVKP